MSSLQHHGMPDLTKGNQKHGVFYAHSKHVVSVRQHGVTKDMRLRASETVPWNQIYEIGAEEAKHWRCSVPYYSVVLIFISNPYVAEGRLIFRT